MEFIKLPQEILEDQDKLQQYFDGSDEDRKTMLAKQLLSKGFGGGGL